MILSNQAKCLKCGDEPYSAYRHDFKFCECNSIAVDGGMSYIKRILAGDSKYIDLSIELDDIACDMVISALEWSNRNNRNELGALCAIARGLRDIGYEIKEIDHENLD